jgi:HxlR-like helix-turn-helix
VARDVLTRRLTTLIDEGVLVRVPYQEPGARTRHEYRLTQAGKDLRPVLLALIAWGDRYRAGPEGVPATVVHAECGQPVHLALDCEAGHHLPIDAKLRTVPGPGARRAETRAERADTRADQGVMGMV